MLDEIFGEPVYGYSREQAFEDGVLVDVSQSTAARECRYTFPIAMTRTVWDKYVEVPPKVKGQDVNGRLWDIVYMLSYAIKKTGATERVDFTVYVRNDNRRPKAVRLKAVCTPGDDSKPTITIMLPGES
jgi:hypothetical protein